MIQEVKRIAKEKSTDFSISEFIPLESHVTCTCCFCKLEKDMDQFCIKKHPNRRISCRNGKPRKNNTQLKYQPGNICDNCLDSIKQKKKKGRFHCVFSPNCDLSKVFNNKNLVNHYFDHHSSVKRFKCDFCNYASNNGAQTKKHMVKHTK